MSCFVDRPHTIRATEPKKDDDDKNKKMRNYDCWVDLTTIQSVAQRNVFLAFRVFGAVIVVPVIKGIMSARF